MPFEKGNKFGQGRPKLPQEILESRNMAYEELLATIIDVIKMTNDEVKKTDINSFPLGKRAIINAFSKLDYRAIEYYENRLFGKIKEAIDLSNDDNSFAEWIKKISSKEKNEK